VTDLTLITCRLLTAMSELMGISNKGVDSLGVRWGGCVAVIWEWRRHRREGGKGSGGSSMC